MPGEKLPCCHILWQYVLLVGVTWGIAANPASIIYSDVPDSSHECPGGSKYERGHSQAGHRPTYFQTHAACAERKVALQAACIFYA